MKKIKKCIDKILPLTLAGTTLLSTASCATTKPTAKKAAPASYLLNGFESLSDLYSFKPIDVQPTDSMKYNINTNKKYVKDGNGSLEYEEISGNSHGIFQLIKNTPAAKADVRKIKTVSASLFNTAATPKTVSMIACAESGVTLFIEQTTLEPHRWTQANLDLTKYSYAAKSEIAGFEIRFDIEDATVIYVDNWSISLGAADLPKTDLNKLIKSITLPQNDEEVTEANLDKYVGFVDKVYYAQSLYNSLSNKEKSNISDKNREKLNKCLKLVKNIKMVNNSRSNHIAKWYYGHALTVFSKEDSQYGSFWSANVPKTPSEQSFKFDISDTSASGKVVFWVYNPMDTPLKAHFHGGWQLWDFKTCELTPKVWTKIEINAIYFERDIKNQIFLVVNGAENIEGEFKFTSFYGISAETVASSVISAIDELPDISKIDYSYRKQVEKIFEMYNDLSEAAKKAVYNYSKLEDIYDKILSLRLPEMQRILDTLNPKTVVMPRDYTNIFNALSIYDELPDSDKTNITKAQLSKINALKDIIKDYGLLYGGGIENGIDYVWNGTIARKYDKLYGNYTELNVNKTSGKAQFVDRLVSVDPTEFAQVVFYVYNPTNKDVASEYSHNWSNNVSLIFKSKEWTEVVINTVDYRNSVNFLLFYSDISCNSPWKVTDLYGVKGNISAAPVIKKIDSLPSSVGITHFNEIADARLAYNSLPSNVKPYVTNYQKLVKAEKQLALIMISNLPDADKVEMPKDYTNIMFVKKAYNAMTKQEKYAITKEQLQKIETLFEITKDYSNIYSKSIESGFDYKWNGKIKRSVDSVYGNITELYVQSTENKMAQFADRLLTVNEEYDKVEFYIYNPLDKDVTTEYSHNWKNPVSINLKSKDWTKVSIDASGYENCINLLTFYSDISCESPWKITDLYGIKTAFYASDMDDLIASIPSSLNIDDIELVSFVRQKYNSLSERVKNAVTKYGLLVEAEKKSISVMIDALPSADEAELPRDYANIISTKNNFDKLSPSELSSITDTQKSKLNALIEKASAYELVYSDAVESGFDYKWNGEIKRSVDKVYGNVTELLVRSTELGMAQFADRLLTADSQYMYIEFYIYNPMSKDVSVEYSHNWSKAVTFTLKGENWTKIRINAKDYSGVINLMNFYSDISCDSPWKVTDLYGVRADGLAKILIDKINALPIAENLTLEDNQAVEDIQSEFNNLPDEIKSLVTNSGKINELISKLKELSKAQRKSYPVIIDASAAMLGTDGIITNNNEDSDYGKVFKLSGASYFTLNSSMMTNDYKNCNTVYFYVYNPTSKDIKGYFVSDYDWSFMPTYLLKAKSWNRIEIKDFGAAKGRQLISSGNTIYFYADYSKQGFKISSFYGISSNTAEDIKGLNKIIDVSTDTLVVDGTISKSSDSVFGDVLAVKNSTFLKIGNNLMTSDYKSSKAVVFYIYNPKDIDIDCYFTTDWSFNAYCQLKADSWNRIEITNFGTANNEKMLSSGKDIYFYGNFADSGWLISSFYELDQKD